MRADGSVAPLGLDGTIKGATFLAAAPKAGPTVIMDKLSSHKVASLHAAIEGMSARQFYLRPHSTDL